MSARSIISEGFYEMLIKYSTYLICEGCILENEDSWLEAIHWLDSQKKQYEKTPHKDGIDEYLRQINLQTSDARAYALLTRDDVAKIYTNAFAAQRKTAIKWYASRRTLALFISAPPQELQFEDATSLEKRIEIRLNQLKFQKIAPIDFIETSSILKTIARIENQDELLRRRFIKNRRFYLR